MRDPFPLEHIHELTGPRDELLGMYRAMVRTLLRPNYLFLDRRDPLTGYGLEDEILLGFVGFKHFLRDCVRPVIRLTFAEPLINATAARLTVAYGHGLIRLIPALCRSVGWLVNDTENSTVEPPPIQAATQATNDRPTIQITVPDDLVEAWQRAIELTHLTNDELFTTLVRRSLDRRNLLAHISTRTEE